MNYYTSISLAKLRITRDNIVITIADVTIANSFLGIPNVKETTIRSFGFPLIQQTGASQASFTPVDKLGENIFFPALRHCIELFL